MASARLLLLLPAIAVGAFTAVIAVIAALLDWHRDEMLQIAAGIGVLLAGPTVFLVYQERSDRLIISRVFDSPKVPQFVLDYLMYHELLHKFLGIGRRNDGRRCMHGADFREIERRFRHYDEATRFLKKL